MGTRTTTFVTCDRCGSESGHDSPHAANLETVQLRVTGQKVLYAPHHTGDDHGGVFLCRECAHSFRDWWRADLSEEKAA